MMPVTLVCIALALLMLIALLSPKNKWAVNSTWTEYSYSRKLPRVVICDLPQANLAKCAGTASATLKPRILRTLGAREFILGTAIEVGVVYLQTGNESLLVNGSSGMCD